MSATNACLNRLKQVLTDIYSLYRNILLVEGSNEYDGAIWNALDSARGRVCVGAVGSGRVGFRIVSSGVPRAAGKGERKATVVAKCVARDSSSHHKGTYR